jgi:transposase
MDCDALRDDQWERIKGFVPGGAKGKRGPRTNNRRFLDALLWMPVRGSLARSSRTAWRLRDREAAPLD